MITAALEKQGPSGLVGRQDTGQSRQDAPNDGRRPPERA
jgi:hypothetical protein